MAIDYDCDLLLSVAFFVGQSAQSRGLWTSLNGLWKEAGCKAVVRLL